MQQGRSTVLPSETKQTTPKEDGRFRKEQALASRGKLNRDINSLAIGQETLSSEADHCRH